jgi:acetyl/propionyl-CoA carboxylase alpha subunit
VVAVSFFERECSIQRGNQKIIEEAPAPFLSTTLREQLRDYALRLARKLQYTNVGTVEFMVSKSLGPGSSPGSRSRSSTSKDDTLPESIYFLEVNTRLQVEHAVTEQVTGIDLVGLQLHLAEGHTLPLAQNDITCRGHSIECRIYTEDPAQEFRPATGTIALYEYYEHPFARYDHSISIPHTVTPLFDPMLSKVVATGSTRTEATATLQQLLQHYRIVGVTTNILFLAHIVAHTHFAIGALHTQSMSFLIASFREAVETEQKNASLTLQHDTVLAATIAHLSSSPPKPATAASTTGISRWKGSAWK